MVCYLSCIGSRSACDEFKAWVPFLIFNGIFVIIAIVLGITSNGNEWMSVVIVYGSWTLFWCLIGILLGRVLNDGWLTPKVKSTKRLDGKTAIVTGANSGIGYQTAKDFVSRGAHVIITCRSKSKAETTIQNITAQLHDSDNDNSKIGSMDYVLLDLCSKKSVDAAIESILSKNVDISILVNNAGASLSNVDLTEDRLERMFEANYQSPFYLTKHLLPNIKATSKRDKFGRIVNVASSAHGQAIKKQMDGFILGEIGDDNANRHKLDFWKDAGGTYGTTKCCQVLHAMKLQELLNEELDGSGEKYGEYLWVTSCNPGAINSNFFSGDHGLVFRIVWSLLYPYGALFTLMTPLQGAQNSIHLSISDDNINPGGYHGSCRPLKTMSSADAFIPGMKDALYQVSDQLWTNDGRTQSA